MTGFPTRIFLLFFAVPSLSAAALSFDGTDLHEHYQFSTFRADVKASNFESDAVHIISIEPVRRADRIVSAPHELAGGASGHIIVEVHTEDDIGSALHGLRISTSDGGTQLLQLRDFGITLLTEARPEIDLGVHMAGGSPRWQSLKLESSLGPALRITKIEQVPDFATARIGANGGALEVAASPHAGWGWHQGFVRVALDSELQTSAAVRVQLDVHGDVVPAENPFALGVVRKGVSAPALLRLRSRNGEDFVVGSTDVAGFKAKAMATDCRPAAKGCRMLSIAVDDSQPTGRLSGEMHVHLEKPAADLAVGLTGILIERDTKIIPLDVSEAGKSKSNVDLANALQKAASNVSGPARVPPGKGPLLKWRVANEGQLHGYFVFRADSEPGPYRAVTGTAIPATTELDPDVGVAHAWRDTNATPGKTYWYYIASIYLDGRLQQLTGPQKVVAK